ncbi:MAG: hypothetical protein O2954_17315, partial [bacterium]|nr:hypothetical protein [bacterium]
VEIERDKDSQPFRTRGLVGNVVRIYNGRRVTAYTLSAVESHGRRYRLHFGKESFCIGRFKIGPLNPDGSGLTTPTNLYMASQGYYQGARLVNETLSAWHPVTDVTLAPHNPGQIRDATIRLEGTHDLSDDFTSNHIAYLYDFGPGDRISILPRATALRRKDGSFRIQANCKADLSTT